MLASPDNGVPYLRTTSARQRRVVMPLLVLAVVGVVILLVTAAGQTSQLRGAGSTLAQPLIERSATAYRNAQSADRPDETGRTGGDWRVDGSGIDYEPVGSLGGVMRLERREVDFAVSDYPLSADTLDGKHLAQFPVAVGAIALAHNLDLPDGQVLRLDAATLAGIYLGRIGSWQDPAIRELNPGLSLPDRPITPVHRTDGSGSTFGFTGYLMTAGRPWADGPGAGTVIAWPTGPGAERSSGLIAAVQGTPGSLGYVEPGQARRAGLHLAQLRNASGRFVLPEAPTMRAALSGMDWTGRNRYVRSIPPSADPAAYPITVPIYAMLARDAQAGQIRSALSYLTFLVEDYDADVAELGYLPLPADAAAAVKAAWERAFAGPR